MGENVEMYLAREPDPAATQGFFMRRLKHFVDMKAEAAFVSRDEAHERLIDSAIFSTYTDCVDLGMGHEARNLLHSRMC